MLQECHHVGCKVGDAVAQVPFPPHIEGDGAEMAREGRDLPEPPPTPKAQAIDQDQGWPLAVDVVVYASIFGDNQGHVVTSRLTSCALFVREQRIACLATGYQTIA